jgi:hypothetical protein
MRIMTVAFALGTALVLCNLGTFNAAAHARLLRLCANQAAKVLASDALAQVVSYTHDIVSDAPNDQCRRETRSGSTVPNRHGARS